MIILPIFVSIKDDQIYNWQLKLVILWERGELGTWGGKT